VLRPPAHRPLRLVTGITTSHRYVGGWGVVGGGWGVSRSPFPVLGAGGWGVGVRFGSHNAPSRYELDCHYGLGTKTKGQSQREAGSRRPPGVAGPAIAA
jgi:hypothetical protein